LVVSSVAVFDVGLRAFRTKLALTRLYLFRAEIELSKARIAFEAAKDDEDKATQAIGIDVLEAMCRLKSL
jgi:hypothetical protein